MVITLSDQTQTLIEGRMKQFGMTDPDELLFTALQLLDGRHEVAIEELDEETRAAIEEADSEEGLPWEQVREELKQKYGLK